MARPQRVWPALVAFLAAIALEVVPLPDALQHVRPPLPAMVLIYWTMMWPERFGLFWAFCLGLILDILHGQLLGENALALSVVTYVTVRFHLQIRIFPLWQMTVSVLALLMLAAALRLVVEGIAGYGTPSLASWPRVLVGALLWPVLMGLMDRVRMQSETRTGNF